MLFGDAETLTEGLLRDVAGDTGLDDRPWEFGQRSEVPRLDLASAELLVLLQLAAKRVGLALQRPPASLVDLGA